MSLTINNTRNTNKNYFLPLLEEGAPDDIIKHIFSFLDIPDLASAASASKRPNQLSKDPAIWLGIMKKIGITSSPNATTLEMQAKIKKIHEIGKRFSIGKSMASESITIENTQETLRRINEIKIADTLTVWQEIYDQAISNGSTLPTRPNFDELKKSTDRNAIKQAFADWIENNKGQINLTALSLSNENLLYLPKPLFNLTQLIKLDLSRNKLTSLPEEIGKLTQLIGLNLRANNLTSLPEEIGKLTQLQWLLLHNNNLTSLPEEIGKLTQLQYLILSGNNLTSIPEEIGKLTLLQELFLSNNNLTSLPKEIGKLILLQWLNLDTNNLTSIPKEIRNLIQLINLDLSSNNLTFIPKELGNLTQLIELDLYNNNLTSIPKELGNLTQLRELNLFMNSITHYPKALDQLTNTTIKGADNFIVHEIIRFFGGFIAFFLYDKIYGPKTE